MGISRGVSGGAVLHPTLPTVASVGAEFHATGVPTATFPSDHILNDILILILQWSNDSQVTAPAGYSQVGPQNGIGAAAAVGSVKLGIFWKRDNGAESVPTIPDTGDHTYGVMLAIRGCPTSGDPFLTSSNTFKLATSTAASGPASGSRLDSCLLLDIFGHGIDATGGQASAQANTDLDSLTEQFDGSTTDSTGGGIVVMSGTKATAGAIGATTMTWASTTVEVCTRVQMLPLDTTQTSSSPRPTQVQTFIGSVANLDDIWTKPSGARKVFVQLCDGGGGASGGRSAATAEGGGGGGGGGYCEAWYNPDDLAATVTVHAGKGGAAGSADGAGNVGVVSEFDKGNPGPLTSTSRVAGTAATAAITADGGNGGCGSGTGTASPAVSTTRRPLNSGNAACASSLGGAPGGSGTTASTGGSEGDWGGGGGESGSDTDASITPANNGSSMSGAGGGGGGRTTTNVGQGGNGGGATNGSAVQGAAGTNSSRYPYGGSGGNGGGSSVAAGGAGGFPGGGGGGGGGVASGTGGKGGDGMICVTCFF